MVRDLVENAIQIVEKSSTAVYTQVLKNAEKRLVKILVPGIKKNRNNPLINLNK